MRLPRPKSRERALACVAALILVGVVFAAAPALAQSTGKIVGTIKDEAGGALAYANVSLLGTPYGSMTNQNGAYNIDLIPVGTYVLQVGYMGYETQRIEGVVVDADRSTEVDVTLMEEVLQGAEVLVEAERPLIDVESTGSVRGMDAEETKIRPINTVAEAIATQPGVVLHDGQIHVRGGRASEVKMYVDGIAISNSATGGAGLEVSLSSLSEFDLLSGGFDAEYGNVQSGVINLATREGGRKFSGEMKYMTDDYGAPEKTFDNFDNLAFGFGGPLFTEKLRYYVSGEGRFTDTYLKTDEVREASDPFWGVEFRPRQSMFATTQAKISYFATTSGKLTGEYLLSQTERDYYSHSYSRSGYWSVENSDWSHAQLDDTYEPYNAAEHTPTVRSQFSQKKLVWRDTVSPTVFYTVRVARFESEEKFWLHENPNDYWWQAYVSGNRTTDPDSDNDLNPETGYFRTWGDNLGWSYQTTGATTVKGDITNQPNETHQFRTGMEVIYSELSVRNLSLGALIPSANDTLADGFEFFSWDEALNTEQRFRHDIYEGYPANGAFYVQDRMRYEGMIVRAGLRLDWSDPGASSGIGEYEIWRERISAVVSPRLGIAHPISDRDALHFHYGRFYQMPRLVAYYASSESIDEAPGGRIVGYSGLEPEVTTSYQFGAEHQFSQNVAIDITGFYKDIFGLLATEEYQRGPTEGSVYTYVNKDYSSVQGIEFRLTKRFSNFFSGNVSYTWLQATGVSSDENQGANAEALGLPRQPLKEIPLNWDERHTLTGFLFVSDPGNWEITFDYSYGSGTPYTPVYLGQKEIDPESVNSGRLPSHTMVNLRGTKKYRLYEREFRLFFEALNVFDKRNVGGLGNYGAEYYTESGNLGGAYLETDPQGREVLEPLHDPSTFHEGRVIRVGIAVDW